MRWIHVESQGKLVKQVILNSFHFRLSSIHIYVFINLGVSDETYMYVSMTQKSSFKLIFRLSKLIMFSDTRV